ncbi:hypothetical protein ACHAXT_000136 [Thalassiosira profunda]
MASPSPPAPPVVVGVDLGALSTKLTLGPHYDHELVRNAHGGHSAPTAVTFPGQHRARLVGEDAADIARGDGNTVGMLDRLLAGSLENGSENDVANSAADELAAFRRFELRKSDAPNEEPKVHIPSMDEEYSTTGLLAALLGRARRNALATIARLDAGRPSGETTERELHFVFAVPASYPQITRAAVVDAAYAAGIQQSSVVDAARCLAAVYAKKFGDEDEDGKAILVVEMGHARTSVSVLKKLGNADQADAKGGSDVEVLSTVASPALGAGLIDVALYRHFLSTHPKLAHHSNDVFADNSRAAQRLLEGCKKLKHLLSMLPENTVTVENVGQNDTDVTLTADRELLRKLCEETVLARLTDMIGSAMAKAAEKAGGTEALGDIASIEITGGGTRVPMVQDCVRAAAGMGGDFALSKSLDDTSLAFGASLVGAASASEEDDAMDAARIERRAKLREAEAALSERDARLIAKDECRNKIEAHILELRSARHSTHGDLLPTSDEFTSFLDGTDDWLFSEECDGATLEQMEQKWTDVEATTQEMCGEYLAAKKAAAEKKDREMEAEALRAAAAAAANGEGDDADHDTRKLPTKRRMEIVMKNKAEANELFADGNYRHAAARYAKALTHATKFFDLSPEEAEEVKEVKLSLHLNLALAYLKLEKLDNAHRCCNDALALDESNVKALYRRATVLYQTRKFDEATKDLDEAEKLAPDDKAVKKLRKLVDQQVAKQKKKERAFAKKMFG